MTLSRHRKILESVSSGLTGGKPEIPADVDHGLLMSPAARTIGIGEAKVIPSNMCFAAFGGLKLTISLSTWKE